MLTASAMSHSLAKFFDMIFNNRDSQSSRSSLGCSPSKAAERCCSHAAFREHILLFSCPGRHHILSVYYEPITLWRLAPAHLPCRELASRCPAGLDAGLYARERARAVALVQQAQAKSGADHARLGFLVLALRGQKVGFERVIKMIDEMVTLLKKEQTDDAQKKEYCGAQFDSTDDKKKSLTREVSDLATAIASAEESISAAAEDISALEAGIAALDKSVAEATALRKGEHEEYKALMAADGAAKELLLFAKNRLNQFYNQLCCRRGADRTGKVGPTRTSRHSAVADPKLYNPPAKVELSAQGAIERDMTSAAALVQMSEHSHRTVAAAPPPETWSAYAKKTEESGGVIAMLDLLVKDLDREMTEAETEEKDSQADYDTTIADAKDKRMTDSKALTSKAAAKADLESDLQAAKDDKASTAKELMVTDKYLSQLHAECDWLIQYYDAREQARSGEIDALGKAKAVLSGADYSLL
ncbi:unnamed protein product [Prorocentrum cordatum]|uniref:Uncharacterized protein n=1 Tax=Prorocentrum cordatum TaxID=2364126 RepID=A0ABN9Q568_9DINO|nr:unnamed protein product [Polarella glacialis]